MNEIEARRMSQARARLLAVAPFYGAPSLRLQLRENLKIDTLCTDGTHIDYNPNYTSKHSVGELMFDVAHETGHCLLLHPFRVGNRDLHMANVAGDYCINALLVDGKFEMPKGLLLDRKYDGMGMETVYAILYREREQERERNKNRNGGDPGPSDDSDESESDEDDDDEQQSQGGSAGNEPSDDDESDEDDEQQSGSGSDDADDDEDADESDEPGEGESDEDDESESGHQHFVPAPQPSEPGEDDDAEAIEGQESASDKPLTAEDWQRIAEQAVMIQRKAGNLPGGADRAVELARQSGVDWVAALKEFIVNTVPTGQDWTHPDRRFIADGSYMPGSVKENTPPLAVAIDASGSVGPDVMARFLAELNTIANEVRPERIDVVSFDDRVTNVDSFEPDEEVTFDPKGGGGTYFNPVLVDWMGEQMDEGNPPAALIFCTDLDCADLPVEPEVPVLWVVPEWVRRDGPFGQTIRVPVHG